ncbi:Glyoxalase/bleomycin resistance protein/dioxygenase superfamily protein (modular protein) [Candidatus Sulfopaludibacter sp. SbA4]|nr:Glyoxalase/bleomycin resistance protein/dioxygenase superfamily protein (modular protein) [Candidatus Sulfopaludibacter sp. SbA4]
MTLNVDQVFVLHSAAEPTVEMPGAESPLLRDYLQLFTRLVPREVYEPHLARMRQPARPERFDVNPIPHGFHSLTLHLIVDGAAAYIEFLKNAFGAVEIFRSSRRSGKVMDALLKIGDSMLMLADDFNREFGLLPVARGNLPFHINLYVADADATFARAVAAGAEVTMPIGDQTWGDRYGHVRDPFGFNWVIATRKENLTPEQMQKRVGKALEGG